MRVAIIGPGAVGCTLGAQLARAGREVVFLAPDEAAAEQLERRGVTVEGVRGSFHVPAAATCDAARVGPVDLAILTVKAYDTSRAMWQHAAVVGATTVVATFQNGLGNVEAIGGVVGAGRVLGGTTALGANLLAPGHVHHAGEGDTFVGEPTGGRSGRAEHVARVLTDAGIPAEAVTDVTDRIWAKLAINAGINALTALLRVRNGVLAQHPETLMLLEAAVREAAAVARARGVPLEVERLVERAREVAGRTADNVSSMLADMLAGRRTEIAEINGAVAVAARALGVPAPINEALAVLVCAAEATRGKRVGEPAGASAPPAAGPRAARRTSRGRS
jgi:2-dehydropantoate 2-reductase